MDPESYRLWPWCGAVIRHAMRRMERVEGRGVIALATIQTVVTWVSMVGFVGTFGLSLVGGVNAVWTIVVGAWMVFMVFILAPFQLWREQAWRADESEAEMEAVLTPKLTVSASSRLTTVRGRACVVAALALENVSLGSVNRCHVEVQSVQVGDGNAMKRTDNQPFLLRWPKRYAGEGHENSFHDRAEIDVFHRATKGSAPLNFFAVNESMVPFGRASPQVLRTESVGEYAVTDIMISVSATDAVRWRGTLRVEVDPTGAGAGKYDPLTGMVDMPTVEPTVSVLLTPEQPTSRPSGSSAAVPRRPLE